MRFTSDNECMDNRGARSFPVVKMLEYSFQTSGEILSGV